MVGSLRVLTQNLHTRYVMTARTARPPTTPPAIAPTLVERLWLVFDVLIVSTGTQVAYWHTLHSTGKTNWHCVLPSSHFGQTSGFDLSQSTHVIDSRFRRRRVAAEAMVTRCFAGRLKTDNGDCVRTVLALVPIREKSNRSSLDHQPVPINRHNAYRPGTAGRRHHSSLAMNRESMFGGGLAWTRK